MLTKNDIYALLDEKNIAYEIINHKPRFQCLIFDKNHAFWHGFFVLHDFINFSFKS